MATATRASACGLWALWLLAAFALPVVGCGSSVKELEPSKDASGRSHRQFRVECIEREQCQEQAQRACSSTYKVVAEWHNTIPESELPGLNEQSHPKDARDWNRYTLPDQTGIESNQPMPLTSIVVACNG